ncbi:MAG: cellulase family glycosylhydrolase [Melioribacter sp.]|uniref:cellulase family glycosylhydrolase n=1 Tax=Rosettibacter primus TaxID=3111523 RepID=UPI00247D7B71|nr:cellulase family glycosylhydrolase [Melioribacter sp.]
MKRVLIIFLIVIINFSFVLSQNKSNHNNVFVDSDGMLRWEDTKEEVRLFGVNYTTPFAYAYRAHKRLGLSLKKAIDLDVNHLARLGFDAFRIHMWDREISDSIGNVLQNEHLKLFDYLLYKLAQKGIKTIITPIAWWGTAWPEPDYKTPGFSTYYSKVEMITNPKAREAQKNYLKQIINHVNPYTKLAYKDDPSIIALEIINEPHHPDDTSKVRQYINEMYDVLREAGFTKPIFYNISENWNDAQAQAVCNSKVEGVSFQWYPTGLVHNKILNGNYLINVNKYKIPSENVKGFDKKAKMVYEFDAADIGASFMYPAMARSFREAGIQFATMFAYDPVQIAWSNTEYQTHFVNLLYAPSKAISLMIASKAFHELQGMKSYGDFPANNNFDDFIINYEKDLCEYNSLTEFIYSNSTDSKPVFVDSLKKIAGVGNSPIIHYDGTGAYFFDKIKNGMWKLEVYPDVLWLSDPFEQTSMKKQISKLFWEKRKFKIDIPDLGSDFQINSLNKNLVPFYSQGKEFVVEPGIYLLVSKSIKKEEVKNYLSKKEKFLDGLYLPPDESNAYVVNKTPLYLESNNYKMIKFQIASPRSIKEAAVYIKRLGWRRFEKHLLKNVGGFDYLISDSAKILTPGQIEYCVALNIDNKVYTFPDGKEISPEDWDFHFNKLWKTVVVDSNTSIELFNALRDYKDIVFPQFSRSTRFFVDYKNGITSDKNSIFINLTSAGEDDYPFGFQLNVSNFINPISGLLQNYKSIILRACSEDENNFKLVINLITKSGNVYQSEVSLDKEWIEKEIKLSDFHAGESLILPFSYPRFLPKIWKNKGQNKSEKINLNELEFIQFLIIPAKDNKKVFNCKLRIESLLLK